MDSLRVDNGLKRIEVNDDGEYIEFSINDDKFLTAFWDFWSWMKESEKEINNLRDKNGDADADDESGRDEAVGSVISLRSKINNESCERIDAIFGTGASRKIFGRVTPDMYMVVDFLEKISPFIKKYADERKRAISSKYNKNRKGAKS